MTAATGDPAVSIRPLRSADIGRVIRIDAQHTGRRKPDYWRRIFGDFVARRRGDRVALAAQDRTGVLGYLFGEVRAFEFGSEPCGWIFAVGVDPVHARRGVASRLLDEARRRFRRAGVDTVRTMVRRDDVPVLSFFRSSGFVGGSFVEMEADLGGAP
jgi:ribosomal protein S18 acetylase RimI-like enzyme